MIEAGAQAVELNPSYSWAYTHLGVSLAFAGRDEEALANLEKGMRLCPLDPLFWQTCQAAVLAHFSAERYEEAVEWADRAIQDNAGSSTSWRLLAASYACLNRSDEARTAIEEALRLQPNVSVTIVKRTLSAANPDLTERYLDGLRKAGLPD